jgi:chromosome segregation ATPase
MKCLRIRLLLSCLTGLGLPACGLKRVPATMLESLPYESKIELLESENDLAAAVDRLDESESELTRFQAQIRRSKERLSAAEKEVRAAEDAKSKEIADLAVIEAERRLEYLRARQKVNVKELELAEQNLDCAVARHERSKLTAARKAKVEGSESLDIATFEAQLKRCEEQYASMRSEVKAVSDEAEQTKVEWEKTKAAMARKTFDARASPFVE